MAPQQILILGGTNFLGPAVVNRATERGHALTLFNRGFTRPELFPEVEKLAGDRNEGLVGLAALAGNRRWDAVIDLWPEEAEIVGRTVELLEGRCSYYYFVSSIAVYRDFSTPGLNEDSPIHENEPGWYGGEKARAEEIIKAAFPGAFGIARPHAILGPRDDGHAYHYWLRRLALEKEVLAPGSGQDPVQFADVRDVAAWILDCVEQRRAGVYNLTGPEGGILLKDFLEGTKNAIGSDVRLVWLDADFLRQDQGVHSFTDLPLWAPLDEDAGFYQVDGRRAIAEGMVYRPLAETARDAWRWFRSYIFRHTEFPLQGLGLPREREEAILEAWQGRTRSG